MVVVTSTYRTVCLVGIRMVQSEESIYGSARSVVTYGRTLHSKFRLETPRLRACCHGVDREVCAVKDEMLLLRLHQQH